MGEKPRNIQKYKKTKTKEKIPRLVALPDQSGEGSLKRQPTCLRQRKYSQSVKDQREDVHGVRLRPTL